MDAAQFVGGKILLAMSEGKRYGTNENPAFYLADPDTGAVSELCDLDPSLRSTVGSDCRYGGGSRKAIGDSWYYTSTRGYDSFIVRFPLTRLKRLFPAASRQHRLLCTMSNGTFYYVAMRR